MLTVLLEIFYLGRISKLQLVFWNGLVVCSWSRMIRLTSMELLHLADSIQCIFNSEKIIIHWVRHWIGSRGIQDHGCAILLVPDLMQVSSPRCLFFLLFFPFSDVAVIVHRVSPSALAASVLLGEHQESHTWTKSVNLVHYTRVLAPVQALFGSDLGSFSLASCDQWQVNGG